MTDILTRKPGDAATLARIRALAHAAGLAFDSASPSDTLTALSLLVAATIQHGIDKHKELGVVITPLDRARVVAEFADQVCTLLAQRAAEGDA